MGCEPRDNPASKLKLGRRILWLNSPLATTSTQSTTICYELGGSEQQQDETLRTAPSFLESGCFFRSRFFLHGRLDWIAKLAEVTLNPSEHRQYDVVDCSDHIQWPPCAAYDGEPSPCHTLGVRGIHFSFCPPLLLLDAYDKPQNHIDEGPYYGPCYGVCCQMHEVHFFPPWEDLLNIGVELKTIILISNSTPILL